MSDFPEEKITENKKPWREAELIDTLRQEHLAVPPATLRLIETAPSQTRDRGFDGILEAEWRGDCVRYVFEYKANSLPRTVEMAQLQVRAAAERERLLPLVIVPYLREESLRELEERQISGIDLCGNGLLLAPGFRIWRTGYPNLYKDTRPIRNPYRGDSSIFARCFLLRPAFDSLASLREFAHERTFGPYEQIMPKGLSLGTASKVVQSLVDEMVVARDERGLRLIDARRLLVLLRRGAKEPARPSIIGKTPLSPESLWTRLSDAQEQKHLRSVATGIASAGHYRVLSGVEPLSLYVDRLDLASERLAIRPGRAFANIQLFEERKNVVYFDAHREGNLRWASPIQTWLELASAGPREQEAAEELEGLLRDGHAETLP